DPGPAAEFHEIVDRAELALTRDLGLRAVVAAVVEDADDLDAGVLLALERLDNPASRVAAADDHGAAGEPALPRPVADGVEPGLAFDNQAGEADQIEGAEPQPGEFLTGFGEEGHPDHDQEDERPGRGKPHVLLLVPAEGLHLVDV